MKIIKVIRKFLRNMSHSAKMSEEISDKMSELIAIVQQLTLNADGTLVANQHNAGNVNDGYQGPPTSGMQANARQVRKFDR